MHGTMKVTDNKNGRSKCRICDRLIKDKTRVSVDALTDAWGNPRIFYYHAECIRATIGYDQSNEEIEQTTSLIELLAKILNYTADNEHGKTFIESFIRRHPRVWNKAESYTKEFSKK